MILGVNIDHVATLRQARLGVDPDPVMAAPLAILGGADGITVHLREDRRHINDRDLRILREIVHIELNLEMAATKEMIDIAKAIRPDMVTLVPEKRQELTTEGGLDVIANRDGIADAIKELNDAGMPVSLFINPYSADIDTSKEVGANMVEIHTGMYSDSKGKKKKSTELKRVVTAVEYANSIELVVNVGHGLNYDNVKAVASTKGLRGLYIGHSIIARAMYVGLERAVSQMKQLIRECMD